MSIAPVYVGELDIAAENLSHLVLDMVCGYVSHFIKMYENVGIATPKTIETRCRYCGMQARQG